ncbi:hypothetical protein M569_09259 [Genlisea aurea]|uniref:Uncharacterized protein n=1 Tax=Genlisea aurea TaxID=192259 RepID=S8CL94_9LAMI|nr:hypothetical protein M569_09259 [Genlisea aurea]
MTKDEGIDRGSSKRRRRNQVSDSFTEKELEVAEFLLDLRRFISLPRRLAWGKTKKRSPLSCTARRSRNRKEDVEAGMPKVASLSPDTPLSFPASDVDRKSAPPHKKKKSKNEYADMIETLTQRRNLLLGEIETVNKYRKRLVEFHSHLKACKSERAGSFLTSQPQPSIGYPTMADYQRRMEDRRPLLIDLNVAYEEGRQPQALDSGREIERARYAEARRHRLVVMKRKKGRRVVVGS